MYTVWHKSAFGGLVALVLAGNTWAEDSSAQAAESWAGVGLWAGVVAVILLGALGLFLLVRARNGTASGAGSGASAAADGGVDAAVPRGYSPKNVGNDASARPWESSLIGASLGGSAVWSVPEDFDVDGFLVASKANFVSLQGAWDRSDIANLRAMMTDSMLEQIKSQLAEREQSSGGKANTTEVVMLEARFLGIEEQDAEFTASVEFSGMLREDPSSGPNPFREVWNITRPKAGSGGWLVAGVQALQ